MACAMLRSTLMRSPSWISHTGVTRSFSSAMICCTNSPNSGGKGRSTASTPFDFNVDGKSDRSNPDRSNRSNSDRSNSDRRVSSSAKRQQRRQQPRKKFDPRQQQADADAAKLQKYMQPNWHEFQFDFSPERKEIVLHTGMVPHNQIAEVRKQILLHTDFSAEIKKINRKENPVEAYFLRLVASGLGKNPAMTVEDKQNIISTIRKELQEK
eukprot:m.30937 g.30937  ORF g.30937 m.30937 type:complete len:211 (-) comp16368_c0_seq1:349-981(-)